MNQRVIAVVAALAVTSTLTQAQNSINVNYSGGTGGTPIVVDSSGTTPVPDGNFLEIGYFDAGFTANIGSSTANLVALNTEWHLFGQTAFRPLPFPTSPPNQGRFGASASSFDATFGGKEIDLWVFHTSDNAAPAPDFSNVIEYGLFTGLGSGGHTLWAFPAAGIAPGNTINITTADVDHAYFGGINSGVSLQLAPVVSVPEPGAPALAGLGLVLFGLATRRLRR